MAEATESEHPSAEAELKATAEPEQPSAEPEPESSHGLQPTVPPPMVLEWPTQLEFMPAHEQGQLKQEVAQARRQYTEGSPMMEDEHTRLERKYCVDTQVLQEVFSYVAAHDPLSRPT